MNKDTFDTILTSVESHTRRCQELIGDLQTVEDLKKKTLAEAQVIQSFCRRELSFMDRVCTADIYHIIGMGNLSPTQMMKFTYAIHDYLSFRSTIKTLAMNLEKISAIPTIPVRSKYQLTLGGITLSSGEGELTCYETASSTEDIGVLPFTLKEKEITVEVPKLSQFISLITEVAKSPLSEATARNKMIAKSEYLGVQWKSYDSEKAVGVFKSEDMYKRVKAFYDGQLAKLA